MPIYLLSDPYEKISDDPMRPRHFRAAAKFAGSSQRKEPMRYFIAWPGKNEAFHGGN